MSLNFPLESGQLERTNSAFKYKVKKSNSNVLNFEKLFDIFKSIEWIAKTIFPLQFKLTYLSKVLKEFNENGADFPPGFDNVNNKKLFFSGKRQIFAAVCK